MELREVQNRFFDIYGDGEAGSFHSPGRVNLIGEHTDYNGGSVFPCALSFGTFGVARRRDDNLIRLASTNFELRVEAQSSEIVYNKKNDWGNYLLGIVKEFQSLGFKLGGVDVLISGNIPNGAGLSSSASVELLMSVILNELFDCKVDMVEMVKLSQRSENNFIGLNCGIMDQFAIGMGKKDNAILLNCGTLDYKYIDAKFGEYKIVIGNTNKMRKLGDSKYNERCAECGEAVKQINAKRPIQLLGELNGIDELNEVSHLITSPIVKKRAEHVVSEIARTNEAAEALTNGQLVKFGQLLVQSHESLRDLYEVTGFELDTMVELSLAEKGVLGSRMTGAGFGGCTVSIVKEDCVSAFIENVSRGYLEKTKLVPEFYIADVGDGTKRLV